MKLDLRKDFADVYSYISEHVRRFDEKTHNGLGGPGKVKMIDLGFEYAQSGWLVLVLDTRPNAEPDGEWTSQIEGNEFKMPHWFEAAEENIERPITLILPDGGQSVIPPESELGTPIGEMLKAVLLKARADGLFAALPKAAGCELGIENFDGCYGWPMYEDRGKENLA